MIDTRVLSGYGKEHAIGIYGEQQGLKLLESPTFQIPGLKVLEDPRLLIFKSSKLIVKVNFPCSHFIHFARFSSFVLV
jgi:hypothetical protein